MNHLKLKCNSLALSIVLLLLSLPFHGTSDLNSEKQALLAFADSVRHGLKLNWKPSTPICSSWVGVTCTKDHTNVFALRLPGIWLSGEIPPNTIGKLDRLQILSLRSNHLNGSLPPDISSLPSLHHLHLQHNLLTGNIPTSLSSNLISLDLSYNSFSGEIPASLRNLSRLTVLNLQNNSLSGPIPDLKLKTLRHLNFSYNDLNGSIPHSLQNFPNDSYVGNTQLCGPPLPQCSAVLPSPAPQPTFPQNIEKTSTKRFTARVTVVIIAGGVALFLLLVIVLTLCVTKRRRGEGKAKGLVTSGKNEKPEEEYSSGVQMVEKNKLVFFEGCSYAFDLEDLLRASAEVLGKGGYGTAYKAALEDGMMVVVKRLKEVVAGKKEFEQQMGMIGRVGRHPNLVPVRAYYYSKDEKLLVYDYAPHGSFSSVLHGSNPWKCFYGSMT